MPRHPTSVHPVHRVLLLLILLTGGIVFRSPLQAQEPEPVWTAFDLETTGLRTREARIVEIGAVRFTRSAILATTNWLVNPGIPIPPEATRIHGIRDTDVSLSPSFAGVYPHFTNFTGTTRLIAYNARYDKAILNAEIERAGLAGQPVPVDDALVLARRQLKGLPRYTLETVARHLKLDTVTYHRAQGDAFQTARIVQCLSTNQAPDSSGSITERP